MLHPYNRNVRYLRRVSLGFSVGAWREVHLLDKRAVEGAQGIKAHKLAYFGNAFLTLAQMSARLGNAERVYIVVKADVQLVAEKVRDVIFADEIGRASCRERV